MTRDIQGSGDTPVRDPPHTGRPPRAYTTGSLGPAHYGAPLTPAVLPPLPSRASSLQPSKKGREQL